MIICISLEYFRATCDIIFFLKRLIDTHSNLVTSAVCQIQYIFVNDLIHNKAASCSVKRTNMFSSHPKVIDFVENSGGTEHHLTQHDHRYSFCLHTYPTFVDMQKVKVLCIHFQIG